jgi:hypothetical protein
MASEPRMPIGRSRCGFLVSSAVVATTSKPMKAKNTTAAPATTPAKPNTAGSMPSRVSIIGAFSQPSELGAGCDSGMNGV